jgi:hypothetical protein
MKRQNEETILTNGSSMASTATMQAEEASLMAGRPKLKLWCMQTAVFLRVFESVSGGADGNVIGLNGSVNARSATNILNELEADGKIVFDFGAGEGRFLIAAICSGARKAIGVEFPENTGYKLVLDAVVYRIALTHNIVLEPCWIGQNIDEVRFPLYVFVFVGFLRLPLIKTAEIHVFCR